MFETVSGNTPPPGAAAPEGAAEGGARFSCCSKQFENVYDFTTYLDIDYTFQRQHYPFIQRAII